MISETKLGNSFPEGQFLIKGYSKPYIIDRNCHERGIMLYERADIPSKLRSTESLPMEDFYVDINLQKKKWLLCCSYNPNKNAIKSRLEFLHKGLALYSSKYENFIVLGDFKDAHREKVPSNKTPTLRKSTKLGIWVVGTSNRLFIRGS